jgi:hypothetical protein
MTLWLPVLDYAFSFRPLVSRIGQHVPSTACIAAPSLSRAQWAALEYFGDYRVDGRPGAESASGCTYMLRAERAKSPAPLPAGWSLVAYERRPTDRDEVIGVFIRDRTARE